MVFHMFAVILQITYFRADMRTIDDYDVKIFTDNIEEKAIEQIRRLMSIDVFSGCKIRIMPDVHAGAGCVIGFTGYLGERVIPNIVGVDIGCGMLVQPFECSGEINFHEFNQFILSNIPSGREIRSQEGLVQLQPHMERYQEAKELVKELRCFRELNDVKRLYKAAGSLGGDIYQKQAVKNMSGWDKLMEKQAGMIEEYKAAGRRAELQEAIRELHNSFRMQRPPVPAELCWLEGQPREDYLHDMRLCQRWAQINRGIIMDLLVEYLRAKGNICSTPETLVSERFESVHNYIGDEEKCIIPMNMRDGSLICTGKGNPDWNWSAPHGAGRIMSRAQAFQQLSMEAFTDSMRGIYSETVTEQTIDESPMVYKPTEEIIANIRDTADISCVIKPVFNFKAAQ